MLTSLPQGDVEAGGRALLRPYRLLRRGQRTRIRASPRAGCRAARAARSMTERKPCVRQSKACAKQSAQSHVSAYTCGGLVLCWTLCEARITFVALRKFISMRARAFYPSEDASTPSFASHSSRIPASPSCNSLRYTVPISGVPVPTFPALCLCTGLGLN